MTNAPPSGQRRQPWHSKNFGGKRPNQMGRPPVPTEERTVTISTSLPKWMAELIQQEASDQKISVSQLLRHHLSRRYKKPSS